MKEHNKYTKYTVYHIPGIKFGCSKRFKDRCQENYNRYGRDISIDVVLETTDINEASEFEEFCNQEAGYKTSDSGTYVETMRRNDHPDRCRKISEAMMGNKNSTGKRSEETKRNNSIAATGEKNGMFGKTRTKGRRFMTDGTQDKMVNPDEVETYQKNGWRLGKTFTKSNPKQKR